MLQLRSPQPQQSQQQVVRRQVRGQLKEQWRPHQLLRQRQTQQERREVKPLSLQQKVGQVKMVQQVTAERLALLLKGTRAQQRVVRVQPRVGRVQQPHLPSSPPSSSSHL
jgi:hypothetical protein